MNGDILQLISSTVVEKLNLFAEITSLQERSEKIEILRII